MGKIRNLAWIWVLTTLFFGVSKNLQAGWQSPGTGYHYTMDTLTIKDSTDITSHTSIVTWEADSGYYILHDSLIIGTWPNPDTLTIGPGTVIHIQPGHAIQLEVCGVLKAKGETDHRVIFKSHADTPQANDWNDLRFSQPSGTAICTLKYCIVENAEFGVGCNKCGPVILNNIFRNNYWYGVMIERGSPTVLGNLITNVRKGISVGFTSTPYIGENTIQNASIGIYYSGSASGYIVNNLISDIDFTGIDCFHESYPNIKGNTITNCTWGIVVHDSARPVVGGDLENANAIYGNRSSVGSNLYNHTQNLISAEYNYWGSLDPDSILSGFYGLVDFMPYTDSLHVEIYSLGIPPVASANGPYIGNEGSPIIFDGSSSTDDVLIALYEWDFDEDDVYDSAGAIVSYIWDDDHSGVVILRVWDIEDLADTDTTTVVVHNVPPTADAGGPYSGGVNQEVQLLGSATDPGIMDTHTFEWDLDGDGEYDDATGENPTYIWSVSGVYTIYLRVMDDDGGIGTDSAEVTINQPPVADAGGPYTGDEGSPITFDGSNSTDDELIVSYEWDLDGDGVYDSIGVSVSYTWNDNYSGVVILRVTDNEGLTNTDTATVVVNNIPPTADAGKIYTGRVNKLIQLIGSGWDLGADLLIFEWDLDGDGEYDDAVEETPIYTWSISGTHIARLRVTDDDGGVGIDSASVIIINGSPIISDIPDTSILQETSLSLDLSNYVTDDHPDSLLVWTYKIPQTLDRFRRDGKNRDLVDGVEVVGHISTKNMSITLDQTTHIVTFEAHPEGLGAVSVIFTVSDPEGLWDCDTMSITILPSEARILSQKYQSIHTLNSLDVLLDEYQSVKCSPNPFSSTMVISYQLLGEEKVSLKIYDISGRCIRNLVNAIQYGYCEAMWDGRDEFGKMVPNGIYFYRLERDSSFDSGKVVLIR